MRSHRMPLATQLRVIFALIMREMATRYGRSAGGYVWALLEPLGTVLLLTAIFSQIARNPPLGDSFPMFYATGYLAFHTYMDISRAVSIAVKTNRPLLTFPRVTMLDTIIARFILQLLTSIAVFAVVIIGMVLVLEPQTRLDLPHVFAALVGAALLGLGIGTINCVLFSFSPTYERVFGILNRPMFLISGIFFLYETMPRAVQEVLWWNPLLHVTAEMRRGFYPYYHAEFVSPIFVVLAGLAPMMLGILLLKAKRAQMLEGA